MQVTPSIHMSTSLLKPSIARYILPQHGICAVQRCISSFFEAHNFTLRSSNNELLASRCDDRSVHISVRIFSHLDTARGTALCQIMRASGDAFCYVDVLSKLGKTLQAETEAVNEHSSAGEVSKELVREISHAHAAQHSRASAVRELAAELMPTKLAEQEAERAEAMQYISCVARSLLDGGVTDVGDEVARLCENPEAAEDILAQTEGEVLLDQILQRAVNPADPWREYMISALYALSSHDELRGELEARGVLATLRRVRDAHIATASTPITRLASCVPKRDGSDRGLERGRLCKLSCRSVSSLLPPPLVAAGSLNDGAQFECI